MAGRFGQLGIAAQQHLAHGGVVVAGCDVVDVVAPGLSVLHFVRLKHHARGLGGFPCGVGNIKALNAQGVEFVQRHVQCFSQGAGTRLLRAFFCQQACQLQIGIFLRHVQPDAALLARLVNGGELDAALRRQRTDQQFVDRRTADQRGWHGDVEVVLGNKGFEHYGFHRLGSFARCVVSLQRGQFAGVLHVAGKVRPVTQVPAAAHHGQVDAGFTPMQFDGQDVGVNVGVFATQLHRLLVHDFGERSNLVAQLGRQLKLKQAGVVLHFALELGDDFLRLAAQKTLGVSNILRVIFSADMAYAGRRAALDLVEQAGAGAVVKDRVFAVTQAKNFLQQQHGFFDRPGTGIGAEVMVLFLGCAAVVSHAGESCGRSSSWRRPGWGLGDWCLRCCQLEIRVTFVVPEQNIKARVERLDQVVFKQQGFSF